MLRMHRHVSARASVQDGATAIAPRVDDPRGFAIHNSTGQEVTVWFDYDPDAHVMTVVVERKSSALVEPPDAGELAGANADGGRGPASA